MPNQPDIKEKIINTTISLIQQSEGLIENITIRDIAQKRILQLADQLPFWFQEQFDRDLRPADHLSYHEDLPYKRTIN